MIRHMRKKGIALGVILISLLILSLVIIYYRSTVETGNEAKVEESQAESESESEKEDYTESQSEAGREDSSEISQESTKESESVSKPVAAEAYDKVVYLTFDDGPGPYTADLLDLLDKYNVKATFFVTRQYSNYENLIAEEYKRGHTVAVHTYSHSYGYIYQSVDNYYEDLMAMSDVVERQTGQKPSIVRFPGGSSNTISRNYCQGIMSTLSNKVGEWGYRYCDWNVSSGDGSNQTSTDQVYENVTTGISKHKVSIVLQHDTNEKSMAAVEDILKWGIANGYTFLPMDDNTEMMHHKVAN
ncbi:MAG: polysaccharide deacetylase family protein [Lachnospira sp.]